MKLSVHNRILSMIVLVTVGFMSLGNVSFAAFNKEINYQGKLTDNTGATVADGTYNVAFNLYTAASGGTPIWSSTTTVPVSNGLFSHMLGSSTDISGVDFNQTLYLGVNIGGTGAPSWDGEMTPRKVFGAVPAAFEAQNSVTVGGIATSSFLRGDIANSATALLSFLGGFISNSSSTITELTTGTTTVTTLSIDGESYTTVSGGSTGLTNNNGTLTANISESHLNIADGPTDGYVLMASSTAAGGFVWAATTTIGTHDAVTLNTATADYLSLSGQQLTLGLIDLATDTTGTLASTSIEDAYLSNSEDDTTTGVLTAANFISTNAAATTTLAGGLRVDTNGLVYDYSTGNVGIGTAGPTYKLTVDAGDIALDRGQKIRFVSETTGNTSATIGSNTSNALVFTTNGTAEQMRILATGNVGIGTTSPSTKLDIWGDLTLSNSGELYSFGSATLGDRSYTEENYVTNGETFTASIDVLDQQVADIIGGASGLWQDGGAITYLNSLGDELNIGTSTATAAKLSIQSEGTSDILNLFETGGSEVFTVLENGNVGIGTTSPASNLDVWGDARVGTSGTPTFFVDVSTGRVGIGTAAPSALLDIATDVDTGTILELRANNVNFTVAADASSNVLFDNSGNQSFRFKDKIVLDGTDNADLQLQNGAEIISSSGDIILNPGAATQSVVVKGDASQSEDHFQVQSSASSVGDIFAIDSAGKVGIGSSSPAYTLGVVGNAYIDPSSGVGLEIDQGNQTNTYVMRLLNLGSGTSGIYLDDAGSGAAGVFNQSGGDLISTYTNWGGYRQSVAGNIGGDTTRGAFDYITDANASGAFGSVINILPSASIPFLTAQHTQGTDIFTINYDGSITATSSGATSTFAAIRLPDVTSGLLAVDATGLVSASTSLSSAFIEDAYVLNTGDTMTGTLILPNTGLQIGSSVPFSDAAGTLTLQNVDALDATTESTIESAIDTLANLTSWGGFTWAPADAGADAVLGWDDTAGQYENLTASEVLAIVGGAANDFDANGDVTVGTGEITDGTITEADLNLNTPSDGYVLAASSTAAGGFAWYATSSPYLNLATGGAEINNLETIATGIANTEIFIGTGANAGNYAAISGDATLANTGALTLASSITSVTSLANLTTVGALNSGSIASGFGAIDIGTSNFTTGGRYIIDVDGTAYNAAGAMTFGTGSDAGIYFNGTDLMIETQGAGGNGIVLDAEDDTVSILYSGVAGADFATDGLNLVTGDSYQINNTSVLNATTLGSGVVNSSLTSVGTIGTGVWQGTAVADTYVANDLTISASGTIDPQAITLAQGYTLVGDAAGNAIATSTLTIAADHEVKISTIDAAAQIALRLARGGVDSASLTFTTNGGSGVGHYIGINGGRSMTFYQTQAPYAAGDIGFGTGTTPDVFFDSANGYFAIGTTTPNSLLHLENTGLSGSINAGIRQDIGLSNSTLNAVQYGDRSYITIGSTATSTVVGGIIRVEDGTSLGNTIRGFEVQANKGGNTKGENTALSGFARTFGVRAYTSADAGNTFEPAAGYFELGGSGTQGNAIRAYSSVITTSELLSLYHEDTAFTGTGLLMNFGNDTGGSFASTSSKFVDFQNAGTSKFTVSAYGTTTIGDGTTNTMAGLQIGYGGLCVDNDGSCTASVLGRISSVSTYSGNSDLAEMYFSDEDLEPGELVVTDGFISVARATGENGTVLGVVSTKPGLLLGSDDTPLKSGEGYPLALSGRVPVKLSTENGPITVGDPLMLSSLPGVAMKAKDGAQIVGYALEDFDGDRAYTEGFINQFGDDIAEPDYTAINVNTKANSTNGCYYGGGAEVGATSTEECDPEAVIDGLAEDALTEQEVAEARYAAEQEALDALRDEPAATRVVNGTTVRVGTLTMFVDRGLHFAAAQIDVMNELTSTSTELVLGAKKGSDETLWDRLKVLAQNFVDGVLTVAGIKTDKLETSELCVDDVCVTADDLRALLNTAGTEATVPTNTQSGNSDTGNETSSGGTSNETQNTSNDSTDEGVDTGAATEEEQSTEENATETGTSTENGMVTEIGTTTESTSVEEDVVTETGVDTAETTVDPAPQETPPAAEEANPVEEIVVVDPPPEEPVEPAPELTPPTEPEPLIDTNQ